MKHPVKEYRCTDLTWRSPYTGVGKSRFTVVRLGKDMQVVIITKALIIIIIIYK
jgi:hypothetical protein